MEIRILDLNDNIHHAAKLYALRKKITLNQFFCDAITKAVHHAAQTDKVVAETLKEKP